MESTRALAGQGKPVHDHLHDGHPLVPGLADHLSFLTRLPVPFEYQGRRSLEAGRLPLGDAAPLFRHWRDLTNAERMNAWLEVLTQNATLVPGALSAAEP